MCGTRCQLRVYSRLADGQLALWISRVGDLLLPRSTLFPAFLLRCLGAIKHLLLTAATAAGRMGLSQERKLTAATNAASALSVPPQCLSLSQIQNYNVQIKTPGGESATVGPAGPLLCSQGALFQAAVATGLIGDVVLKPRGRVRLWLGLFGLTAVRL